MYTLLTMDDPRWKKLAAIFCQATKLKKGDNVLIRAIDLEALPLLSAIYKQALIRGAASVNYQIDLPELEYFFLKRAKNEQLEIFPEWNLDRIKKMDVYMSTRARTNGLGLKDIPNKRVSLRDKITYPILDEIIKNTRWCLTEVPTDHDALLSGMSTPKYFEYYFQAALQDYAAMKTKNLTLKKLMEKTEKVTVEGGDTSLEFSIKNIPAVSCHGECNIPDGEVYTSPVKDSVNGWFSSNAPSFYQGREWSNVALEFSKGRIINAVCDQGSDLINTILDTDDGARYVGEFAIGTNPGIRQPAKSILFDEKIFGSFHFTPGACYDDAPNGNHSAVHWDLVQILTPEYGGGVIRFDGIEVMRNGIFIHPELINLNP
jgi:aminopeptidase